MLIKAEHSKKQKEIIVKNIHTVKKGQASHKTEIIVTIGTINEFKITSVQAFE